MSYILEALKKSEQQREIGRVPGISSVHENAAKSVTGKWLWLIVVVLLLNAGLLVLLLWPEPAPEPALEPATLPAPLREPAQLPRDRPAVAPAVSQPPALDKPVPRAPPAASIAPRPEPPAPEPVKTGAALDSVVQEPAATAATASPAQRQVVQPPGPPPAEAAAPELPVWPQIPTHLFQQLNSTLRLDVHVFGDQPHKSFVLINMRKYREGEKLQEGPQVDEITAEGAILSFRGQRFRLQAQ